MAGMAALGISIVVIAGCGGGDSGGDNSGSSDGATTGSTTGTINGIVITQVDPPSVPLNAGRIVTISGTGFESRDATGAIMPVTVHLGTQLANSTVVSDSQINVVTPGGAHIGTVDVRVLNAKGISAITPNDKLTYTPAVSTTGTTTGSTDGTTTTGGTTTTDGGTTSGGTTTDGGTTSGGTTTDGGTTSGGTTTDGGTTSGGTTTDGPPDPP